MGITKKIVRSAGAKRVSELEESDVDVRRKERGCCLFEVEFGRHLLLIAKQVEAHRELDRWGTKLV